MQEQNIRTNPAMQIMFGCFVLVGGIGVDKFWGCYLFVGKSVKYSMESEKVTAVIRSQQHPPRRVKARVHARCLLQTGMLQQWASIFGYTVLQYCFSD